MARTAKAKAIQRLRMILNEVSELKRRQSHSPTFPPLPIPFGPTELQSQSPEFKTWHRKAQVALRNTFGDNSIQLREFCNISYSPVDSPHVLPNHTSFQQAYVKGLDSAALLLKSMIEEIEEYWEDDKQTTSSSTRGEKQQDGDQTLKSSGTQRNARPSSNRIFVIHGRDKGAKQTVARFLEKLELMPVILSEIPGKGRTIIEKFEQHAQVDFAIVLLTPDDTGSLQGDNNLTPRARQNVIFELGFFIGRLDRKRVCALTKGEVEIPSDYAGIEYIPLDDFDGWKQKLFQELKTAGFPLDANRAFSA